MKKEYENFLLNEYGNSRLEAVKTSLGPYDFIVPYAYAIANDLSSILYARSKKRIVYKKIHIIYP